MSHSQAAVDGITAPVMCAASAGEEGTTPAISSAVAILPSGTAAVSSARRFSPRSAVMSVATTPGATTLTVMPREPSSRASDRAKPTSPAFDAA